MVFNIFNRIRGNGRVGIVPQGLPQELPERQTHPFAQVQPIGTVIPQGMALTNRVARQIPEATPENETTTGTPITSLSQHTFNVALAFMVEDDVGYFGSQPLNFTRFSRALRHSSGRANLYQTFLNSPYALLNDNTQTDETRLRDFYNNYRGGVNIPDVLTERARIRQLDQAGILQEEDIETYHSNFG